MFPILEAVHDPAKGLHKAGAKDPLRLRELNLETGAAEPDPRY